MEVCRTVMTRAVIALALMSARAHTAAPPPIQTPTLWGLLRTLNLANCTALYEGYLSRYGNASAIAAAVADNVRNPPAGTIRGFHTPINPNVPLLNWRLYRYHIPLSNNQNMLALTTINRGQQAERYLVVEFAVHDASQGRDRKSVV